MIHIEAGIRLEELTEKADCLDGFFKLVSLLVEPDGFASKYKLFFGTFYEGEAVQVNDLNQLLKEVELIEEHLQKMLVNKKLLTLVEEFKSITNLQDYLNEQAKNMAELFYTSQGENMLETMKYNIGIAIKRKVPIIIKYYLL